MTPLLILNVVILAFSALIYWQSRNLFVFVPWLLVLTYSLWRHEQWAQKSPHLLAPEQIALKGLELYGTSEKRIEPQNVIDMDPISNPESEAKKPLTKEVRK